MKEIQLLSILFFLFNSSLSAQDTISTSSPFSEARYHYFLKTIIFFDEYLDTDNGSFNTTQVRVLLPIGNKAWNLRFDLPLISANTNSVNKTSIGDVGMGISYIPFLQNSNGIAFRARVYANSAADPNFGTGKWVFMPAAIYGKYLFDKKFLWLSTLEYQGSFAGQDERTDISVTVFENVFFYFFGKNWIAADAAFRYNVILKGFQNNAFVEFGRKITPVNLVYIHPSVAFGGQKTYNFGIEAGILVLF
ncbi:lipid A phosphoethanolamine transferase [Flavobacterium hungaricum]|uniref:Lipid A phosphoethanolamine transferase n=1 Tax=Flavobacterium hungaricum TaxID=2082725 RepID=A0ABR9TF91_9FLAO|nr:lipid A phosphoethanolamine transferase [Flavobacterium hungaricum]MBE8724021.1 lipid A phosphoethanolamine transferase [Flavobacterium hungaricum]